ncbi:MAG: PD-(D/E)XK nuclease family protein [Planctomycetota bacterium]
MSRVFLGWNCPVLVAAVEYFVSTFRSGNLLDLREQRVVFPGARAGRRFLELLVESCEANDTVLFPPRILTVGGIADEILVPAKPYASELELSLAWAETLRAESASITALFPQPPEIDDFRAWMQLADVVRSVHRDLAGEGLRLPDAFRTICDRGLDPKLDRWECLANLQQRFEARLAELGRLDPQLARLDSSLASIQEASVLLVCCADFGSATARLLRQPPITATALVFAPESESENFDDLGRIRVDRWNAPRTVVPLEQIRVADRPVDQASEVLHVVSGGNEVKKKRRTSRKKKQTTQAADITICVPHDELAAPVIDALERSGFPVHVASGFPLPQTLVHRFLEALAETLESGRFRDFASLVRHPDAEAVLGPQVGDLDALDRYAEAHLPERLVDSHRNSTAFSRVEGIFAAARDLLSPLSGAERALDGWAQPILEVLARVYCAGDDHREGTEIELAALDAFRDGLQELVEIRGEGPRVSASTAVRTLLQRLASVSIPLPPQSDAVEVLGWLEVALDDAPTLIVTGFNEGRIPTGVAGDPLLPGALRSALGLVDEKRRFARDAFSLTLLLESDRNLTLIAGRRSAESDPLTPSRLLLHCPREELAARVKTLCCESLPASQVLGAPRPGRDVSAFLVPEPLPLIERPVDSLSVTAFRDYLACPYGFYLRHVKRLRAPSPSEEELDARAFGNLAHDVLEAFALGPHKDSTIAEEIAKTNDATLEQLIRGRYGEFPKPAILVQAEQLRARLHAFAHWQAEWRRSGWRIEHAEVSIPREASIQIESDGETLGLHGRIDRIDRHEESRKRIVFDYKTSERGENPDKTHRRGGEWVDLQLPLYRFLIQKLEIDEHPAVAYILLPKDAQRVRSEVAPWSESEFEEAMFVARSVVRNVRRQIFGPPRRPVPRLFTEYAKIYQEDQLGVDLEEAPASDTGQSPSAGRVLKDSTPDESVTRTEVTE